MSHGIGINVCSVLDELNRVLYRTVNLSPGRIRLTRENKSSCKNKGEDKMFYDGSLAQSFLFNQNTDTRIKTDGDFSILSVDLPGVLQEDIKILIEAGTLTISTIRKIDDQDHSFRRSWMLDDSVDVDNIACSLKNGVLTVKLPKAEKAKPKQILISVS